MCEPMRPTTIALVPVEVSEDVRTLAMATGAAGNVSAVLRDLDEPEPTALTSAWSQIERAQSTYVVTDADPLSPLAEAYVGAWQHERLEEFDGAALQLTTLPTPDFYLVLDSGEPSADHKSERFLRREWYFGVLAATAPRRVIPVDHGSNPASGRIAVLHAISSLPAGAPIPSQRELVDRARKRVPGQR